MPFLGASAIEAMGRFLHLVERDLKPRLASRRTEVPVVPPGARHATINTNGIEGGQPVDGVQTPCVADRCRAIVRPPFPARGGTRGDARRDRRRWSPKPSRLMPNIRFDLHDRLIVHPTRHAGRLADHPGADPGHPDGARLAGHRSSPVPAPTITSTWPGWPACRTAWPTVPARSCWHTSPTRYRGIAELVAATKVIAIASLELMGSQSRQ